MSREPVRVRAIVTAVIQLLAVLGVSISADLSEAIIVLAVALVPLLTYVQGELARRKTVPSDRFEVNDRENLRR